MAAPACQSRARKCKWIALQKNLRYLIASKPRFLDKSEPYTKHDRGYCLLERSALAGDWEHAGREIHCDCGTIGSLLHKRTSDAAPCWRR